MNIVQIEEAIHGGIPFRLKVADGDEYRAIPQFMSQQALSFTGRSPTQV
jgi:hypothetical protein